MFFPEVESRTRGSRPRPSTQKKSEAKAKDSFSEYIHSRGQGQECLRPRTKNTNAKVLHKKIFKNFFQGFQHFFFQAIFKKNDVEKNLSAYLQNFNHSKNSAVLEPRTKQFSRTWGFEAKDLTFEAKAKNFKMCPRGQKRPQGLHLKFFLV